MNKVIYIILSVLLGAVFIFSGYAKLYPIEPFELNFIELGIGNWYTAPFIARGLISFEFLLGLMLIFQLAHKKFTLPATIGLLVFFTLYLVWGIYKVGNAGNCGCFGTMLSFTPLQAIYKNLAMLGLVFILIWLKTSLKLPIKKWIIAILVLISLAIPIILNPPDLYLSFQNQAEQVNYALPVKNFNDKKHPVDSSFINSLLNTKNIVAFVSLTCPHCKIAALKLAIIKKQHPTWPISMVIIGNRIHEPDFFNASKAYNLNNVFYNSDDFLKISGPEVPVIMAIEKGIVKAKINYINLKDSDIAKYVTE